MVHSILAKTIFCRYALFANFQNSLINLTNIPLFLIKDQGIGWTLMVFLQLLFSLYASYQCFRVFNFNKISSLIASCVYSFSLFSIVWLEYGIHTYVAAFLPLIILCIEKYGQTKKTKFLVFISFLIALQFYGGYPQYSIYTLIFTSLYFLFFQDKNLKNKINFFTKINKLAKSAHSIIKKFFIQTDFIYFFQVIC